MKHLAFAVALTLLAALLSTRAAEATPGAMCMHRSDCSEHEVCLADSDLSDHGHCVKLRVLP
jgi:hypothetical protein